MVQESKASARFAMATVSRAGDTELVFLTGEEEADTESRVYIDDTAFTPPETIVVERAHIRLNKLLDVIGALRSSRDARSVGERVLSTIFQLTPADRAAILLSDSPGVAISRQRNA